MSHVDSLWFMPRLMVRDGIAENSAELLTESKKDARQNTASRKYRLTLEYCCVPTLTSTSVLAGDGDTSAVGGGTVSDMSS